MLIVEHARLVMLAGLIAWPISFYASKQWLQGFAYQVDVGVSPFAWSALVALTVGVATVWFQAIRLAHVNPTEALKYE
jgi:putative ABC transport system permease protein